MAKPKTNEVVYKCNSKHCKEGGYHSKNEGRTITLKLFIGNDCPLDFEEQVIQVVQRTVEQQQTQGVPVISDMPRPKRSVVPPAFMKAMRPPDGMELTPNR